MGLLFCCVQDLLARIFVANPAERITLSQIKQHPWFLKNLPIELAVSLVVCGHHRQSQPLAAANNKQAAGHAVVGNCVC